MRQTNLWVQMPYSAPCVPVAMYAPHPCGGYYIEDARVYGPQGELGRWSNADSVPMPAIRCCIGQCELEGKS